MPPFQVISNFLFSCKLETGGKIIGFVKFAAGAALMICFATKIGEIAWVMGDNFNETAKNASVIEKVDLQHFKALFSFVVMALCFWIMFSSYELVQGCQTVSP